MAINFPNSPSGGQSFGAFAWNATKSVWDWNVTELVNVEYLVIAGGGSGGTGYGAGGGAGGYRSSVLGESSGRGANAESAYAAPVSNTITVTVGGGAPGASWTTGDPSVNAQGNNGSPSTFGLITSTGGGGGGGNDSGQNSADNYDGLNGGSGGGAKGPSGTPGTGATGQGFDAGSVSSTSCSGGAGAGSASNAADTSAGTNGGSGVTSSITGNAVGRAGGGGGAGPGGSGVATDGGGNAGAGSNGSNGDTNTGGGGGGGSYSDPTSYDGGNGGSGVVILKYPASRTLTPGVGLTSSTATVGDFKVTTFTQGSDTVTFS